MRRIALAVVIAIAALMLAQTAIATPVVGVSANTLPQGKFMLDTWYFYRDYTRAYNDYLDEDGGGWEDLPASSTLTGACLVPRIYYGATDWLTIRAGFPLEYKFRHFESENGVVSSIGLGDIVIDPKIQIYRGDAGFPSVALLAGVRLPTGDEGCDPALSDGSTDFLGGFAATHRMGRIDGHVCVTYWWNGDTNKGVNAKDLWIASVSLEDPITENWRILWEAKGYIGETPDEYYRFYICPGLSWDNGEHLTIGASTFISVMSKGDGGVSWVDFEWAPYIKAYYRFF